MASESRTFSLLILSLVLMSSFAQAKKPTRHLAQDGPPKICNITDYGAKGQGQIETDAIQAAVDACRDVGGTVIVPAGTYISGMIKLGSNMTFRLAEGATLKGVDDKQAYPFLTMMNPEKNEPITQNGQLLNCRRALLYAEVADNLTIEGPGVLDGNGTFEKWKNIQSSKADPVKDGEVFKEAQRPMAIFVVQGTNLVLQNIQVKNAAMWAVVLMETKGAHVSGLNVDSRIQDRAGTRDGFDIVDGEDIHVDKISIQSEDDSICLKSGLPTGLKDVWVTNSVVNASLVANGLKFGTASKGVLQNIHFENIKIQHVAQAAMEIESIDGSHIDGVTFDGITYDDTGSGIYVLLGWRISPNKEPAPGSISNVLFQNISGTSSRQSWGSIVTGSFVEGFAEPFRPENIVFKNVKMTFKGNDQFSKGHLPGTLSEYDGKYPDARLWPDLPAEGLYFRHVNHITLTNTSLIRIPSKDSRPILVPDTHKEVFDAP